jgi:signal transduction histidine kinase
MKIRGLFFKLVGAFLLVIAVASLVMSLMIASQTKTAFSLYTSRNSKVIAERLASSLEEYYSTNGSWQSVDTYLSSVSLLSFSTTGMMGQGMGLGQQNQTQGNGSQPSDLPGMMEGQGPGGPKDAMSALDQRVVLADSSGLVIYDSESELINKKLTSDELSSGESLTVNDEKVGTLIVSSPNPNGKETPSGKFLATVKQAVVNSAVIGAVSALLIGIILFLEITAPVRKLTKAADAIAKGDLNQRVDIRTKDEIGDLGRSFNSMAESLSNAEVQRQHWMADIAHELRTPLAAIQATLEGMQDGILPMDREQVDSLYEESGMLNRLISDLRLLSLAEAGQIKLECIPTNVPELTKKIVDHLKVQADQKEISLSSESSPDLPLVDLDSYRMTEVINNLVTNSLRYTPKGGSINVTARLDSDPDYIEISVTDTGSGIDAENLPHVFDRFYRADKSRTRSSGGSGLGLAIVKQLVEAHHGSVTVESPVINNAESKACGTSFHIRLPIHQVNAGQAE